jgi:polyphosphate glucokinase
MIDDQAEADSSLPPTSHARNGESPPRVLVVDVGGSHVKLLSQELTVPRKFVSGPTLTPKQMVARVKRMARDLQYKVLSIGYPGPILASRIVADPPNLGQGWVGFDFQRAFGKPVKLINDAAMQALGSYTGGKMLFLGLGTGLGSALVFNGMVEPMELAHLPYRRGTFEDYVGQRGLDRLGKKKWRKHVLDVIERLRAALLPEYVVIGGGNARHVDELPENCRFGNNANAFVGGFRLWQTSARARPDSFHVRDSAAVQGNPPSVSAP